MTALIRNLKRHYLDGFCLDDDLSLDEKVRLMMGRNPSPLAELTWLCDGASQNLIVNSCQGKAFASISKLPDSSGFILFERERKPDNCLLLDAYGKERIRLTVPLHLIDVQNSASARSPTFFIDTSDPYPNPVNGEEGEFGVSVWVECAGKHYCELDYHSGRFLWCRAIRD